MNIFILLLIIGNVFIGLGPLFVNFIPGMSSFTIAFVRFFISALLELLVIFFYWIRIVKQLRKINPQLNSFKIIVKSLKKYYLAENNKFLKGMPQYGYLFWLGFLLVGLVVPFYYLSFELIGVTVSTILVNAVPILIIAFYNWVQKKDNFDAFKIIELFLLLCGIITIALSYGAGSNSGIPSLGLVVIFVAIIAFVFYSIQIERDSQITRTIIDEKIVYSGTRDQTDQIISSMAGLRSFYKLFGIHFAGLIANVVLSGLVGLLDQSTIIGSQGRQMFTYDFSHFGEILSNVFLIAMAIICTLIPYTFQVTAINKWPKFSLGFSSWNSMLTVLQPLVGLYIGFFIWNESIPLDYILFTTIFLVISIIIRYLHENSNKKLILLRIRVDNNNLDLITKYLRSLKEIFEVNVTLGRIGLLAHANIQSVPRLFSILKTIKRCPGVHEVEYFEEDIVSK